MARASTSRRSRRRFTSVRIDAILVLFFERAIPSHAQDWLVVTSYASPLPRRSTHQPTLVR